MEATKTKNRIFGFLTKTSLKKFAIILYITVPLLIFATGFAAWTIIGHEITNGANGSFVADGIINSYDYITIADNSNLNSLQLFPTGFVGSDGKISNQATLEITYTLNNEACQKLVEDNTEKTLYADFTLMFSNGNDFNAFFNNLSCNVSVSDGSEKALPTAFTIVDANLNSTDDNYTTYGAKNYKTDASFKVMLVFDPTNADITALQNTDGEITLKFRYIVALSAGDSAGDYQTIYEQMVDENLKPMIDVRITDISPTAA